MVHIPIPMKSGVCGYGPPRWVGRRMSSNHVELFSHIHLIAGSPCCLTRTDRLHFESEAVATCLRAVSGRHRSSLAITRQGRNRMNSTSSPPAPQPARGDILIPARVEGCAALSLRLNRAMLGTRDLFFRRGSSSLISVH